MDVDSSTYHSCPLYDSDHTPLVYWIAQFTGSCIYGNKSALSWSLGYISVIAWLGAQMPQIIANHRNRSVEGLSLAFLINWFLGDFTNFIGCLLTHQLPFQLLLSIYYLFVDLVLSGQYYYYTRPHRMHNREAHLRRKKSHLRHNNTSKDTLDSKKPSSISATVISEPLCIPSKTRASSFNIKSLVTSSFLASFTKVKSMPLNMGGESTTSSSSSSPPSYSPDFLQTSSVLVVTSLVDSHTIGTVFSWLCACLYLTSRLPQIYKNFKRKSTSGTSILLFAAALTGNTTYTLSILLSPGASGPDRGKFLLNALPFLLGAFGTVMFDITIFIQWFIYSCDSDDNFLPTTPHYHHTPHHHPANTSASHSSNIFKYDILENDDISDNELDDEQLEIARATAEAGESSDQKKKSLRAAPSIPLLPTHQDYCEDTPLAKSPQSVYSSL